MSLFSKLNLKSELIKSAFILSSGTILAQAVSYILMPFITRLYTPEDFGEFGLIMRIVAFLAVVGAGRYEFAIPLPKKNEHAFHVYRLTLRILVWTVSLSFVTAFIFWLLKDNSTELFFYLVLVAAITGFTVFINIGRHWAIRMKWFKNITISTLLTSATSNTAKLLAGIAGMGVFGLALSTLLGLIVGSLIYVFDALGVYKSPQHIKSKNRRIVLARRYSDFPKVNLPHYLIDGAREVLIAFLLTIYLSAYLFGSFDHAYKMLKIPLLLVGVAIGQVLYNRLSADYANKKAIYPLLRKSVITLVFLGMIPFSIIYFAGAPVFEFVFGEQWNLSGEIAGALSPWLMANFVASSISMVPSIIHKLRWYFWVGMFMTLIQVLYFIFLPDILNLLKISEVVGIEIISWIMFMLYAIVIVWQLIIVKNLDLKKLK